MAFRDDFKEIKNVIFGKQPQSDKSKLKFLQKRHSRITNPRYVSEINQR